MHATCLSCDIHAATRTPALTFAVAIIFISFGILGMTFSDIFPPLEITSAMPFVMIGWPELTLTY